MINRLNRHGRQLRFYLLEHCVLPLAVALYRLLTRTWRLVEPDPAILRAASAASPLVIATYHGMLLQLIAFRHLTLGPGRRFVVMLSPSLDGRLLAAALHRLGIGHVYATNRSRAIGGSRELIACITAGDVGIIAVDGPRGPRCIAKPGTVRIAAAARAQLFVCTTTASRGIQFGSWDRAHLPAPFARVELSCQLLPAPDRDRLENAAATIQETLEREARRLDSPLMRAV